jgi:uncharacterized protein DUF3435
MGHIRGDVFRYYVNQIVDVDTQSMFLETPSRDALIKLSSHSSLTRDPSAPQCPSDKKMESVKNDPELLGLMNRQKALRDDLISRFHRICLAEGTSAHTEYLGLQRKVRAKQKQLEKRAAGETYKEFFDNVGNQIIEANFLGKPLCFDPQHSTVLPERRVLADLEFKNRDASAVSDDELWQDRIRSLEMRLELYRIQVPRFLHGHVRTDIAVNLGFPNPFPQQSINGLQCPYCLGKEDYHPLARQYEYRRKDILISHFQRHERMDFSEGRTCNFPNCEEKLTSLTQFKSHQASVHHIYL